MSDCSTGPQAGTATLDSTTTPTKTLTAKRSATLSLIALARATERFTLASDGTAIAVPLHGPQIVRRIGSKEYADELARRYASHHQEAASKPSLTDAIAVLQAEAMSAEREAVSLRIAHPEPDVVVVDLGDAAGTSVVIDEGGYHVTDDATALFERTALTGTLVVPDGIIDFDELGEIFNLDDANLHLLVGWLVASLLDVPCPILFLTGEQGTGKSTTARFCVRLLDPGPALTRPAPDDVKDWIFAASNSRVIAIDNLSNVTPKLSDALCQAVTGGAVVERKLYTDSELVIHEFKRSVIITSIDAGAIRGDLGERLLFVELNPISDDRRATEKSLVGRFEENAQAILGALYELTHRVIVASRDIDLKTLPRMADFAEVLAAVDQIMDWETLPLYLETIARVSEDVVRGDPLPAALMEFVRRCPDGRWEGCAAELFDAIESYRPLRAAWPKAANQLSNALKRLMPDLRKAGLEVEKKRTNKGGFISLQLVNSDAVTISDDRFTTPSVANRGVSGQEHDQSTFQPPHLLQESLQPPSPPSLSHIQATTPWIAAS